MYIYIHTYILSRNYNAFFRKEAGLKRTIEEEVVDHLESTSFEEQCHSFLGKYYINLDGSESHLRICMSLMVGLKESSHCQFFFLLFSVLSFYACVISLTKQHPKNCLRDSRGFG